MTTMKPRTVVATLGVPGRHESDPLRRAAARLYDAETALHAARQTHVDEWITAAYNRLHDAVEAHRVAVIVYGN